ncbi:hypothetical protein C0995_006069 [Termitomyces sp. Mi166|nr:hypothetical protein C0995_006069 [Termitomyces sp. Mi166\
MGRWTQEDEDDFRLPEGMKRTGYDADTGRYYFTDMNGSVWEGAQGAQFSEMTLVSQSNSRSGTNREQEDDDVDVEAAPARSDGYQPLAVDPSQTHVSYRTVVLGRAAAYQTILPFFLVIGVLLLLAWRLLISPILSTPPSACSGNTTAYWVQPGDSCWEIGRTNGCGLEKLREMNPGLDCAALMPGTTVCLPGPVVSPSPGRSTAPGLPSSQISR